MNTNEIEISYLALKQSENKQRPTDKQAIKGVERRQLRLIVASTYLASVHQAGTLRLVPPPFVPRSRD